MKQKRKPEINLCMYGQLMYNKGGKKIQWGKHRLFYKWCLENQICAKNGTRPVSYTLWKNKHKMDKDLNVSLKTVNNPDKKYRQ